MEIERCKYTGAWVVRRKDGEPIDKHEGKMLMVFGTRKEARDFVYK